MIPLLEDSAFRTLHFVALERSIMVNVESDNGIHGLYRL